MSSTGCLLGFPNRIDESTLSGGSWAAALPLNNLKTRLLGEVARTTNAATTSSTFNVQFPLDRNVKVVSLTNHNISLSGEVRIRASSESAATNLCINSESMSSHSPSNMTVTSNSTAAPSGAVTADTLVESATNNFHVIGFSGAVVASNRYTFSCFYKPNGRDFLYVRTGPGWGMERGAVFDLATGVVVKKDPEVEATITPSLNGFYRLTLTTVTAASSGTGSIYAFLSPDSVPAPTANPTYLGDGVSGGWMWGIQMELGITATSYYPTTGAALTRPAGYMDDWQSYTYNSGYVAAYPAVYNIESLEWEDSNFWSGGYTDEQIVGYTSNYIHILDMNIVAQYWRVDISDSGNSAGYLQVGRVFIGPAWQPERDAEIGLNLGWESNTLQQRAISGAKYYQRRTPQRVTNFTLNVMTEEEAMSVAFEIDKMAGIDQEILWVQSVTDTVHALRRRYLATMRQLSLIEFPSYGIGRKGYSIEEIL